MDVLEIEGGRALCGTVDISGAKNAALPLLASAILTDQPIELHNLPKMVDLHTMQQLLLHLGVDCSLKYPRDDTIGQKGIADRYGLQSDRITDRSFKPAASSAPPPGGSSIKLHARHIRRSDAPYDIVRTMRASSLILGPLLVRCGEAKVSLPGGCAIGARPLDLHFKALEAMGATIEIDRGYVHAQARKLHGANITFDTVTVTGTENLMMAATMADGITTLNNAAKEPEIPDLANCLRKMGAQIEGDGSDTIKIRGVSSLQGTNHVIIPDRIEAGTFMIAVAMTGGNALLRGAKSEHLEALVNKLRAAGAEVCATTEGISVRGPDQLRGVDCITSPFPGFATDLQAQWMAAMTTSTSPSLITETIFENRFMHVGELLRMGANIKVNGVTATIKPVAKLRGAPVMATDLRASASLILAALIAEGTSRISRIYHLDRGYENIEAKLNGLGAHVKRIRAE